MEKNEAKVSWKDLFTRQFKDDKLIANTLNKEEFSRKFNDDYGCPEGKPFTAWSKIGYISLSFTMVQNGLREYLGIHLM